MFDDIPFEKPFDFTKHSTIGCGGKAKIAYYPRDEDELCALFSRVGKQALILGNCSNVLPIDEDTEKRVICTKKVTAIQPVPQGVYVSAGITSGRLLRWMQVAGYSGIEFLAGIPCTMGGILYMNGGAGGKYISDFVDSVRIYRNGRVVNLPTSDCGYAYKQSVFMQTDDVILGAVLRLKSASSHTVKTEIAYWLKKRAHLPKGKSMGCVFKNPQGETAGRLIEYAGLKGVRVGGVKVSELHANFIINDQGGTSEDVRTLITHIKEKVWQTCAVQLEEEIRYL